MMNSHVNGICRSASFAIHKIGKLGRYMDSDNAEKFSPWFRYLKDRQCKSTLVGLPEKELTKLQRFQNMAAWVVALSRNSDHIKPVMCKFHWLPIPFRERITLQGVTFDI